MKRRTLKLRVNAKDRALIGRAAAVARKSHGEFMRDASLNAAADALFDRTELRVDATTYAHFLAILDGPAEHNEGLRELLAIRPPWE